MDIDTDLFGQDLATVPESAQVQDDAGCSEPSHEQPYLAQKDGHIGPVPISWPPQ